MGSFVMGYMEVIQMEEKEMSKGVSRGESHPLCGKRSKIMGQIARLS